MIVDGKLNNLFYIHRDSDLENMYGIKKKELLKSNKEDEVLVKRYS